MNNEIETHPFEPFLPADAKMLMLGTFPPASKRWCMKFYYPNFQNDMWRIFGLIFFGDKEHFVVKGMKTFDLEKIVSFLKEKKIAIFDTAVRVVRTKNTASDKDLQIVESADIDGMLNKMPRCKMIVTAGQLATSILADHFQLRIPKVGQYVSFDFCGREMRLYRMPSSSRAYPLKVEKKAEIYKPMFDELDNGQKK